jgi:muramoyltetrapeptide carboxypeptidase LdcA involved in peptidoglycan recycling
MKFTIVLQISYILRSEMTVAEDRGRGFVYPEKLHPGDRVAVLSPSAGLPGLFPAVFEQGLRRLQEVFDLTPVEFPTTRRMNSPLEERARDVHAAFADTSIKGIITSIGGEDQIKLLKHLDPDLIGANPKPFFGYSDNTNLQLFLWNLEIVSYYGGAIMVQFGRGGGMDPYTVDSLRRALFERGEFEIAPAPEYTDEFGDWADPETLTRPPAMFPNAGWTWLNEGRIVEGVAWGGCLEIVDWQLLASRYILPNDVYDGCILYMETSEEMPSATDVYRVLAGMGERGLLQRFPAVLIGRPQAWTLERPRTAEEKAKYTHAQEEAVRHALQEYHPEAIAVFNMDFGHTNPQCIIPSGGWIKVDGVEKRISVRY